MTVIKNLYRRKFEVIKDLNSYLIKRPFETLAYLPSLHVKWLKVQNLPLLRPGQGEIQIK